MTGGGQSVTPRAARGGPAAIRPRSGPAGRRTGESTGPHLHYQLMYEGNPIDPQPFLSGVPAKVLATLPADGGV